MQNNKRLDLAELEKICDSFLLGESWWSDIVTSDSDGLTTRQRVWIGSERTGHPIAVYCENREDAKNLVQLLQSLPRLIEMAGMARSLGVDD